LDGGILNRKRNGSALLGKYIVSYEKACRPFNSPRSHELTRDRSFNPKINRYPQIKLGRGENISLK
jgi:hypothetical protein